jgi:hypothetical protein
MYNERKIKHDETLISGQWIFDGSKVIADSQCERIDWLRRSYLILIATDDSGWLKLYQDPEDKRYWQLNFDQGELQGGGPPTLKLLTEHEAKEKYMI